MARRTARPRRRGRAGGARRGDAAGGGAGGGARRWRFRRRRGSGRRPGGRARRARRLGGGRDAAARPAETPGRCRAGTRRWPSRHPLDAAPGDVGADAADHLRRAGLSRARRLVVRARRGRRPARWPTAGPSAASSAPPWPRWPGGWPTSTAGPSGWCSPGRTWSGWGRSARPSPPGVRADGSGVVRVARTPGSPALDGWTERRLARSPPGLVVEEVDVPGPPGDGRPPGGGMGRGRRSCWPRSTARRAGRIGPGCPGDRRVGRRREGHGGRGGRRLGGGDRGGGPGARRGGAAVLRARGGPPGARLGPKRGRGRRRGGDGARSDHPVLRDPDGPRHAGGRSW